MKKKKTKRKIGLPAGTMAYLGENPGVQSNMILIEYDKGECVYRKIKDIQHLDTEFNNDLTPKLRWLRVNGVSDLKLIAEVGNYFKLHPLTLEDIVNTYQRAKIEDYENYTFTVIKNLIIDSEDNIKTEQLSIVLMKDVIITFYDENSNLFKEIDERLSAGKGSIRSTIDYLYYIIVDDIVDKYFLTMDTVSDKIDILYEELMDFGKRDRLVEIKKIQKEMLKLKQSLFPFREVLNRLQRQEFGFINKETLIYFRDINDHFSQIIEQYETDKETVFSLIDLYLSGMSNNLNEIMKILTIISTIFIPLTFIVGIYGMNFKHMPELEYKYGYYIVLLVMLCIGGLLGWWFKKQKWF